MSAEAQEALTVDELDTMLNAVNRRSPTGKRNYALLVLMADTGLRIGEALALETRDIVTEHGQIVEVKVRSGKGGNAANIPVGRRAAVALAAWLEVRQQQGIGPGAVFCTISRGTRVHPTRTADGFDADATTATELVPGRPIKRNYVAQVLDRLAARAGIDRRITPHTLRHTFATHLLRETGNLKLVQQALRHRDVTTTARIYSHLTDNDVAEAVRGLREDPERPPRGEADELAAEVLAALPAEVRDAMARRLTGGPPRDDEEDTRSRRDRPPGRAVVG